MDRNASIDFFISYTKTDEDWAVWIAWHLEKLGYTTIIPVWDFQAGDNKWIATHNALINAKHTIAVSSNEYWVNEEKVWSAAFDLNSKEGKRNLIPIKVRTADMKGIVGPIFEIDLIGKRREVAIELLRTKIGASKDGERAMLEIEPFFPGDEGNPKKTNNIEETPEFKVSLVDKHDQVTFILDYLGNDYFIKKGVPKNPLAYLLYGATTQWPAALLKILYVELKENLKRQLSYVHGNVSPITKEMVKPVYRTNIKPDEHLYILLDRELGCGNNRIAIENRLSEEKVPFIFYRHLTIYESNNPALVGGMLEAWQKLKLRIRSPRHILIFYYEYEDLPKSSWKLFCKSKKTRIDHLKAALPQEMGKKIFLPPLESPNKKLVHNWIDIHFNHEKEKAKKDIETEVKNKYKQLKDEKNKDVHRYRITDDDYEVHHEDLKDILICALKKFA